jgi:hypothetical protein
MLVPEPREPLATGRYPERVETCVCQMLRHAFGDNLVVLDDENFRHGAVIIGVSMDSAGRGVVNSG